jgi:hypothetical protein
MATVPPSLVRLCESQGVDLYALPESELLPAIFRAVVKQHQQTKQLLAKSALVVQQTCRYCPNEGYEREESLSASASPAPADNSVFDSLSLFEAVR